MIEISRKIMMKIFSVVLSVKFVRSVPMDYCQYEVNVSDCGLPPIPIFAYYKPGSRCEIEIWRGCPTYNKFDNEYDCSDACIARLSRNDAEYMDEIDNIDEIIKDKIMNLPDNEAIMVHDVLVDIHNRMDQEETTPYSGAYIVDTLYSPINLSALFGSDEIGDEIVDREDGADSGGEDVDLAPASNEAQEPKSKETIESEGN